MKQQELDVAWKKIQRIFKAYEFPYKVVDNADHVYCWTGSFCHIINPTHDYSTLSNAIHEFAHWIVVHPNRRNKPDFGLGYCPDSKDYWKAQESKTVNDQFAQKEEENASCLGIIIERTLDLDPQWTIAYHNWDGIDCPEFIHVQAKLRRRGILDNQNKFPLKPKKVI